MKRIALFTLLAASVAFSQATPVGDKVPDEFMVRLLRVEVDRKNLENQIILLQRQYDGINQTMQHDQQEIDSIKAEALKAGNRDLAKWDIDDNRGVFIPKAAPPAPPAPAKK